MINFTVLSVVAALTFASTVLAAPSARPLEILRTERFYLLKRPMMSFDFSRDAASFKWLRDWVSLRDLQMSNEDSRLGNFQFRAADAQALIVGLDLRMKSNVINEWLMDLFKMTDGSHFEMAYLLSLHSSLELRFREVFEDLIMTIARDPEMVQTLDSAFKTVLSKRLITEAQFYEAFREAAVERDRGREITASDLVQVSTPSGTENHYDVPLTFSKDPHPMVKDLMDGTLEEKLHRYRVEFLPFSLREEGPDLYSRNPNTAVELRVLRLESTLIDNWLMSWFPLSRNASTNDIGWLLSQSGLVSKYDWHRFDSVVKALFQAWKNRENVSQQSLREIVESHGRGGFESLEKIFQSASLAAKETRDQKPPAKVERDVE